MADESKTSSGILPQKRMAAEIESTAEFLPKNPDPAIVADTETGFSSASMVPFAVAVDMETDPFPKDESCECESDPAIVADTETDSYYFTVPFEVPVYMETDPFPKDESSESSEYESDSSDLVCTGEVVDDKSTDEIPSDTVLLMNLQSIDFIKILNLSRERRGWVNCSVYGKIKISAHMGGPFVTLYNGSRSSPEKLILGDDHSTNELALSDGRSARPFFSARGRENYIMLRLFEEGQTVPFIDGMFMIKLKRETEYDRALAMIVEGKFGFVIKVGYTHILRAVWAEVEVKISTGGGVYGVIEAYQYTGGNEGKKFRAFTKQIPTITLFKAPRSNPVTPVADDKDGFDIPLARKCVAAPTILESDELAGLVIGVKLFSSADDTPITGEAHFPLIRQPDQEYYLLGVDHTHDRKIEGVPAVSVSIYLPFRSP